MDNVRIEDDSSEPSYDANDNDADADGIKKKSMFIEDTEDD
jgi:hypothetical protein